MITEAKYQKNPYLFTNYVHQEVDLPQNSETGPLKKDFYDRTERMMSTDEAQKAFEDLVEEKDNYGLNNEAQESLKPDAVKKMHLQEAIDTLADKAKDSLMKGGYYQAILKASRAEYQELVKDLDEDTDQFRIQEIQGNLMRELMFFQEGIANALDLTFGLIGAIPRLFKKTKGENISSDTLKDIVSRNLDLLNNLCGMQIEIFNSFKKQIFNVEKKERRVDEDQFEFFEEKSKDSLAPKFETAQKLIETVNEHGLHLPVFGCPVLRVKYKKDNVPFFDKMHEWVEDLFDRYISPHWDNIVANTKELN